MTRSLTVFLSAGEVSGDMHAARLASALRERAPDIRLVGVGSHRMAEAGVEILADVTAHAAVGITELLPGLRPIARAFARARAFIRETRPDLVVLVDYQGANLHLARHARALGLRTVYYIAPQEWIWGIRGGLEKVVSACDLILSVFQPEAAAYREAGGRVLEVGHPLLDMVPSSRERGQLASRLGLVQGDPVLALFPGSRRMEVDRLLPPMLEAAQMLQAEIPMLRVVMPVASPDLAERVGMRLLESSLERFQIVQDVPGMGVMQLSDGVLAASGTTILEAAVVGTPVVAAYRVGKLAGWIARRLMRTPYVTLPNILAGEAIVPELLQEEASAQVMFETLLPLFQDPRRRGRMLQQLASVRSRLGEPGAVARAADAILAEARQLAGVS